MCRRRSSLRCFLSKGDVDVPMKDQDGALRCFRLRAVSSWASAACSFNGLGSVRVSGSIDQKSARILARNDSSSDRRSRGLERNFEAPPGGVCDSFEVESRFTFGGEAFFLGVYANVMTSGERAFLGGWVFTGTYTGLFAELTGDAQYVLEDFFRVSNSMKFLRV